MLGLMHRALLRMIEESAGPEAVAEVLDHAEIPRDRYFRLDEDYSDSEWRHLLSATCERLGLAQADAEERFATHFLADSLQRWPAWFEMAADARSFLTLQPSIHNGFYTGLGDVEARRRMNEKFKIEAFDGFLVARYQSPNRLCGLYEALARRVIAHYGDDARVEHATCMKAGYPSCEIRISWQKEG